MSDPAGETWFAARTADAPEALRLRVARYFAEAAVADPGDRIAAAGRAALAAAVRGGAGRAAALDLLAADALITLALLFGAERAPGRLGATAAALRSRAAA